jgi:hypothetical protein
LKELRIRDQGDSRLEEEVPKRAEVKKQQEELIPRLNLDESNY